MREGWDVDRRRVMRDAWSGRGSRVAAERDSVAGRSGGRFGEARDTHDSAAAFISAATIRAGELPVVTRRGGRERAGGQTAAQYNYNNSVLGEGDSDSDEYNPVVECRRLGGEDNRAG